MGKLGPGRFRSLLRKVLIANRGEIAVRVIRACRELGLRTVAVYSEADRSSLHVAMADEAVLVGPAPARQSYLSIPNLMRAVSESGADAVHPGYGFLAENRDFAQVCELWGVKFIGPRPEAIGRMGGKAVARQTAQAAGVPVVPGTDPVAGAQAVAAAQELGYPLMVKASAGGGGRGIRVVEGPHELEAALERASSEAQAAFGSSELYLERLIVHPRHVEIQVIADEHGHVVTLGERESSLQRRRQKVLEEAPAAGVTPALRQEMSDAAARVARAVDYVSAGTVEFLLDAEGRFYFIEMNTRIQVEHACTELVTGVDIVKEQIRVAQGEPLSFGQEDVQLRGWAIECRINAENPARDFAPSPGVITEYRPPGGPGIRVDAGVAAGSVIPPFYDSMVAKLLSWGRDRPEAIARMRRALDEFRIEGIHTTIALHQRILEDPRFLAGQVHTSLLEASMMPGPTRVT